MVDKLFNQFQPLHQQSLKLKEAVVLLVAVKMTVHLIAGMPCQALRLAMEQINSQNRLSEQV